MTRRWSPLVRISLPLAVLVFLAARPALPSGFQVMTHGARATGMGLAFTAVANDPSAIFYNPAGLGWQKHFETQLGTTFLTKIEGDFEGANPYPGNGRHEDQHATTFVVPNLYAVAPLTREISIGFGTFSPYGLGYRWDNPEECNGDCATNPVSSDSFSGRYIAQNAVIQSVDLNPVISFQATPAFALAVGVDYRVSKVTLERNQAAINPFTQSVVDVAHVKLTSELTDNHGWGWNAGIMYKPVPQFSLGAAYRSRVTVDYEGEARFQQRFTRNPVFDAAVTAQLPAGSHPVRTAIEFPSTINLGAAFTLPADLLVSLEADWTEWSTFDSLDIMFTDLVGRDLHRPTNWNNSWAYRVGLEKKFGKMAFRAGYYRDNTPQPIEDVGPVLADNDRNAYSLGFGFGSERWSIDISDLYLKVKDIDTRGRANNDGFYGVYKEAVNIFAFSLRLAF